MNDGPPQVPEVEAPRVPSDDSLERLEESTLDKQAKSASFRAVYEHNQHVAALNSRINKLQVKLDKKEEKLEFALPRVAELEQASRTTRLSTILEAASAAAGTVCMAFASFTSNPHGWQLGLMGAGIACIVLAMASRICGAAWGWPSEQPTT